MIIEANAKTRKLKTSERIRVIMKPVQESRKMRFQVGDSVVYPGYGVGRVIDQEERVINETSRTFLVITFKEAEN